MRLDGSDPLVTISNRHGKAKSKTNYKLYLFSFKPILSMMHACFLNFLSKNSNSIACVSPKSRSPHCVCLDPSTHTTLPGVTMWKKTMLFCIFCLLSFLFCYVGISQPYRIDIFEDYIYGTGLKHDVFKIHKFGKLSVEFQYLGVERPTNVFISHRYKQQDGKLLWNRVNVFLLVFL